LALPQLILPRNIGGTNLYDAVERALRNEFKKIVDRRALIVLTDGRDTSIYRHLMLTNRLPELEEDNRYQRALKVARASTSRFTSLPSIRIEISNRIRSARMNITAADHLSAIACS